MTDQQLRLLVAVGVHCVIDKLDISWFNNATRRRRRASADARRLRIAYLEQVLAHLIAHLDHLRNNVVAINGAANGKEE